MDRDTHFTRLYESHYAKVVRLCQGYFNGKRSIAEDAAQDIFIQVWKHLDSFREESSISTWIYRITVNTCLLYLRKPVYKREIPTDFESGQLDTEATPDESDDRLKQMYGCISKLEENEKAIILMVLEQVTYPEIAQVTGISEDTLRVRIHRIKKKLTDCVKK